MNSLSSENKKFSDVLARLVGCVLRSALCEELDLAKSTLELYARVFEEPQEYIDDYELILEDLKMREFGEEEREAIASFLRKIMEELS